jgi:glycosyltransferase involved in cell wall biosynthesis
MSKKVTILLSTYNGEKYLQAQLDSLYRQTHQNLEIIVRDDKSSDNTVNILSNNELTLLESTQNLGVQKSFSTLLEYALKDTDASYFMFCDQDDIWHDNKVSICLKKMLQEEEENKDLPLLIHTDLEVVDESLKMISSSFWEYEQILPRYNNFNRLLMKNTITGCTMLINKPLALLALPIKENAVMHDWWLGLVASKFGKIYFLAQSTMKYRQHHNNAIGAKQNKSNQIIGVFRILTHLVIRKKKYMQDMQINFEQSQAFLEAYSSKLDERTTSLLESFSQFPALSFLQKRQTIYTNKLYKQGFTENLALWIKI